jgi:hypothetical protein
MIEEVRADHRFIFDLYISGPMTGKKNHNFDLFHRWANFFRKEGLRVFNPAENFNGDTSLEREEYLRKDVEMLTKCGAIFFLPEWGESQGAQLEYLIAQELKMKMYALQNDKRNYELK